MKINIFIFTCTCAALCTSAIALTPPTACTVHDRALRLKSNIITIVGGSCPAGTYEIYDEAGAATILLADPNVTYDDSVGKYQYTEVCLYQW